MSTRYYVATNTETKKQHLVESANQSSVRNYLARTLIDVRVATQKDVERLIRAGAEVERPSQDDQIGA